MGFNLKRLRKWQERRKSIITKYACKHSCFYEENRGKLISKKIMMDNFSTFNTLNIDKDKAFKVVMDAENSRNFDTTINGVTVGLSSGTSGNRGLFLVSESERLAWCGNILAKMLPLPLWRAQKIALFLRSNSPLYETVNSRSLSFAYFDLLEDPQTLQAKLKAFSPDILVAPPSMLLLLAGSCLPKKIISVAEVLTTIDEKLLEAKFGQKIFQIYQCTEGFLGFTCSFGTLHLNEDLLLIEKEYIDEERFIPIITDLFRKSQPIIRYRLDDILVEKKSPCPCGCVFKSLTRIEGRCDDLLYVALPQGGNKPLFSDFINRKITAAAAGIEEYEVVQTQLDKWEIYLKQEFRSAVKVSLHELFSKIGCLFPELIFVDHPFPKLPGAKLRRIRREYATI